MTKSTKTVAKALGDAELVLLASGGKHADHLIEIPETMKVVTRQRAAANIIKRGLAEERAARPDDAIWRADDSGRFSLAVTAAGLAAIGIEDGAPKASRPTEAHAALSNSGTTAPALREGSKGALVVAILSRPTGTSIDELMAATGWLPHTTRAALTGLRKRGFEVLREQIDGGPSRYRIAAAEPKTAAGGRRGRKSRSADVVAAS